MRKMWESIAEKVKLEEFYVPMDNKLTADTNWNNPDIRPNQFDSGFQGWFQRLNTWGEVRYEYFDRNGKKNLLDQNTWIKKAAVNSFTELYQQFRVELRHIYEVDFIRTLSNEEGKVYEEVLKVYVKLKPELKKGLTFWTKLFN